MLSFFFPSLSFSNLAWCAGKAICDKLISVITIIRVGYEKKSYNEFMAGFEPLVAPDVADAAAFMLTQKDRVSVKALDVVPTAQRSLQVFDREWNSRSEGRKEETM